MDGHAGSPEERETLLEDAVLLSDGHAVAALFEADGVLGARPTARGHGAIAAVGWPDGYVADPRHVLCAGDLALVVGPAATNVARRDRSGSWRYVISLRTYFVGIGL